MILSNDERTSTSRSEPHFVCEVSLRHKTHLFQFVLDISIDILFFLSRIRSLPYKITTEDMYDIFGKYGAIRQIRVGSNNATRGTAYVVYEDIFEAKNAFENLNGFQVAGRYLVVRLILFEKQNYLDESESPVIQD